MACLYSIAEVSSLLKVNKNRVYELIRSGHLKALKFGALKVTSYELEDFIRHYNGKDLSDLSDVKELKID